MSWLPVTRTQKNQLRNSILCFAISILIAFINVASGSEPAYSVTKIAGRDGKESLVITIPARNSRVAWSDVAQALTKALDLNDRALTNQIPTGELNLDSTTVSLALLAINITLNEQLYFTRSQDTKGLPVLVIRCNPAFIREQGKYAFDSIVKPAAPRAIASAQWDDRFEDEGSKPVILCIHGYASDVKLFDDFRGYLRSSQYVTGAFTYDFHQGIAQSARQLAEACHSLELRHPHLRVAIVAHSMGGLVARSMLEDRDAPKNVCRLIMVGTPNSGSMWGHCPPLLGAMKGSSLDVEIAARVVLGIDDDEGFRDLKPDSAFLKDLNSRPRNANVAYTCFVGTRGLMSSREAEQCRQAYERTITSSVATQLVQNRLDPFFSDLSELIDGSGDGAVAIQRCHLNDVQDCVQMPFGHTAVFRLAKDGTVSPVWQAILKRLREDTKH